MKKKWMLSVFGVMALAFGIASGFSFSQDFAFQEFGLGKYAAVSPGVLFSVPSDEEIQAVADKRMEMLMTGQPFDFSPAQNEKLDALLPETKVFSIDSAHGESKAVPSTEVLSLSYHNDFAPDGTPKQELWIRKVPTKAGNRFISEPTSASPALIPSPNRQSYLFEDNGLIYTIDAATLAIKQVTQESVDGYDRKELQGKGFLLYWAVNPKWSPDGTQIAYFTNRGNPEATTGGEIWIADLKTGEERKVFASGANMGLHGWSASGEIIIWEEDKQAAVKLVSLDGTSKPLLSDNENVIALSPGGNQLLYSTTRPHADLWILDVGTGAREKVAELAKDHYFLSDFHFSPSGNQFVGLAVTGTNGERSVYVYDFQTKKAKPYPAPKDAVVSATPEWVDENLLLINHLRGDGKSAAWILNVLE